ncbi:acyl-CoA dehydrogenase family protein [Enterococcus sp. AZ109]|uniref:acyl-CoA dehydrogenase family protein n=1 Tax=Enterococcus sp. AZ109 TaxID=2774634 RepID=UPI003F2978CB
MKSAEKTMLEQIKQYAETTIRLEAKTTDQEQTFPKTSFQELGKIGLYRSILSVEDGGLGYSLEFFAEAVQLIAKNCSSLGVIVSTHVLLVTLTIAKYGNNQQKQSYLPPLMEGSSVGAFALTEKQAGSDISALKTNFFEEVDGYRINGEKRFITNAQQADLFIVFAKDARVPFATSAFILERSTKGLVVKEREKTLGIRGSSISKLVFENCCVSKSQVLGALEKGEKIALNSLISGRVGIAAQAIGIADRAFEEALNYTNQREQFGRNILSFQHTKFSLAKMKTEITAGKLLIKEAAGKVQDRDKEQALASSMAKYYCGKQAVSVVDSCMQLMGGCGYLQGSTMERLYRDAKITEIYEGTKEVQKMVIANEVIRKFKA